MVGVVVHSVWPSWWVWSIIVAFMVGVVIIVDFMVGVVIIVAFMVGVV
jgi:hypothetical protein